MLKLKIDEAKVPIPNLIEPLKEKDKELEKPTATYGGWPFPMIIWLQIAITGEKQRQIFVVIPTTMHISAWSIFTGVWK